MNIHGQPSQRWEGARESERAVWQPLMLITPERLECTCGNKAIFLCVALDADGDLCDGEAFCQSCFEKAQQDDGH